MAEEKPPTRKPKVALLPPRDDMTVEQAIQHVQLEQDILEDVLIFGFTKDGELYLRSSHMKREWSLWLTLEMADYIRKVGRHSI